MSSAHGHFATLRPAVALAGSSEAESLQEPSPGMSEAIPWVDRDGCSGANQRQRHHDLLPSSALPARRWHPLGSDDLPGLRHVGPAVTQAIASLIPGLGCSRLSAWLRDRSAMPCTVRQPASLPGGANSMGKTNAENGMNCLPKNSPASPAAALQLAS